MKHKIIKFINKKWRWNIYYISVSPKIWTQFLHCMVLFYPFVGCGVNKQRHLPGNGHHWLVWEKEKHSRSLLCCCSEVLNCATFGSNHVQCLCQNSKKLRLFCRLLGMLAPKSLSFCFFQALITRSHAPDVPNFLLKIANFFIFLSNMTINTTIPLPVMNKFKVCECNARMSKIWRLRLAICGHKHTFAMMMMAPNHT